ncbi:MAG: cation transporting ATPase C-terminal domain-containing protein, partial [Anaerolineae bacterium]|nr:cation transporting ATPase C-terminal domain-containing protein [Anaerolineae bacterium]
ENGIMEEPPKSTREPILNRLGLSLIGMISVASAVVALMLFRHYFQMHNDPVKGRSIAFASFATNSMVYILAYRSMRRSMFRGSPLSANKPLIWAAASGLLMVAIAFLIPGLRQVLGIVPLHADDWLLVIGVEAGKAIANRRHRSTTVQVSHP